MNNAGILQITKSKTRTAILELFFNDPEQEYYLRQLEKLIGYSVGNIRREMINLEGDGLFTHRMLGNIKLYRLNKSYPIYNEFKEIIRKTIGIESKLKDIMQAEPDVVFAFIYGSFAKGKEQSLSDVDIMIIGKVSPKKIRTELFEYQSSMRREINSTVYAGEEFLKKLKGKNHFICSIIEEPKIFLKGDENEFRRFIQVREVKEA